MMKHMYIMAAGMLAALCFGGVLAACAAGDKKDDGAIAAPQYETAAHALMGTPKKVKADATQPVACKSDSDCFSLKYFQADQCNVAAKCITWSPFAGGVCDVAVLQSCLDTETSPWPNGEGCNFVPDPDGSCNDNNACTTDYCNPYYYGGKGGCAHPQASDEVSCGTDGCLYKMPACVNYAANPQNCDQFLAQYVDGACTDNDACTNGDKCGWKDVQGVQTFLCLPGASTVCDDSNVCTDDSCDPTKGCVAVNNTVPCDDANACTSGDACKDGKCEGGATVNCDDVNACTDDYCNKKKGCEHLPNTATCTDDDACTSGDACKDGKCEGAAVNCDDANPCTNDVCGKVTGCVHANNTVPCNDVNACTSGDACKDGKCEGAAVNCDDANPCTDDSCNKKAGCEYIANTAVCNDNNACTSGDACDGGKCVATAVNCDDGNICTDDSCDKGTGCQHANNIKACDDGDKCSDGDACKDGKCSGANVCEPEAGNCDDGKDNDKSGAADCQDPACAADALCGQQTCKPVGSVACNTSWPVSVSGSGVLNKYACFPPISTPGPEKFWQFVADGDYAVSLKLTDPSDKHIVVVLKGECKPSACETDDYKVVSFSAKKGGTFFFGVDTLPGAVGDGMTLEVACSPPM